MKFVNQHHDDTKVIQAHTCCCQSNKLLDIHSSALRAPSPYVLGEGENVGRYLEEKTVIIAIPVLLVGGTEIQTLSVVKALISAGYRVIVCCYHEYVQDIVEQFEAVGAKVKLLQLKREYHIPGLLSLGLSLAKVFRSLNPDMIHVQYIAPGLIPIIAARLAGVPVVLATVHIAGSVVYGVKTKMMLRIAAKLCSAFICVSKGVEEFWFGSSMVFDMEKVPHNRKHFTIYNAVDIDKITKMNKAESGVLRRSLNLHERLVIGIVGRLALQKGHTILLDALVEIKNKYPNVALLVIGDGPERQSLQLKADKLGLTDVILWLGAKSQDDVFNYYQVMDIFVMPSLYEGFGLTAAEAMACELPVVSSNVAGLSEVIEHEKSGLLVSSGDSDALKLALLRLIEDRDMAFGYGVYGRQRVQSLFSLRTFEQTMLNMYHRYLTDSI
ncbi:MAG: glycosyltransferase [Legionellaceae bacterium]|nr:glycosyltransferase [Legionellaceae bacterium]